MSEKVFESIMGGGGGNAILLECNKRVYAYASVEPLKLRGKHKLTVQVPQTSKPLV